MFEKSMILIFSLLFFLTTFGSAQENANLEVKGMVFCTAVEDRQPVGADSLFFDTVERVYCFTRITGAEDTTSVSHIWYHGDEEMAAVDLAVRSKSWRTWSSKQIMKEWSGIWRVDVVSSDGKLLISKEFLVKPETE